MQASSESQSFGVSSPVDTSERSPFLLSSRSYNGPSCRICLSDDETGEDKNLLISPCKCTGTSSYVHYNCLAKWIQRSHKRRCQICKSKFQGLIWQETSPTVCQSLWRSKPATKIKLIYFLTWFIVIIWLSLQVYIHSESIAYSTSMSTASSSCGDSSAKGDRNLPLETVSYNSMIGLLASFTFFYTIAMLLIWMTWVKKQLAKKAKADVTVVGHLFTPSASNPKVGVLLVLPAADVTSHASSPSLIV